MKYPCIPLSWKLEETLQLLQLVQIDDEWSSRVSKLEQIFGDDRPPKFFTEKSCKDEFDRVMSSGHPEHFFRQQGEKYSQKELIQAWIVYLQKQYEIQKTREGELLLIKLREKASLFNRICADDCDLTDEEITRLLDEAREEDSKRDPEVVSREVAIGMQKLKELQELHETYPEKYPALKIVIPPSHPSEASTSAAPFSPIKPLFEGLTPPSQLILQAKAAAESTRSGSLSPKKVNIQKDRSVSGSPRKGTSVESVNEILDDAERLQYAQTRLRTLSTGSRSVASNASSFRPESERGKASHAAASAESLALNEEVFRSPGSSLAEAVESVAPGTSEETKVRHTEVKIESDEAEGTMTSSATEETVEKKEMVRTRRSHRNVARLSSSDGTSNVDETPPPAQHEHALRTRRPVPPNPQRRVSTAKVSVETGKDEKNIGEVEEEGKLRRSERHHAKAEPEAALSAAPTPVQIGKRKRNAKLEAIGDNEDERTVTAVKRRRLLNKDAEDASKKDIKGHIESTMEEQSSPEPENEERTVKEPETDDEKTLAGLRKRRSSRAAAAEEKVKEKTAAVASPETVSSRPPRKVTASSRTSRRQTRRGASTEADVEQKAFMVTAWRMVSSHRHAAIFAHPVSDRDARGYSKTVKSRMDLSTLKKQLDVGELQGMKDFKRKVLLMFANAVMFNSTGHDVNHYAKEMAADTLDSLKMLQKDVLFVRGGAHMTRRSAAFAAEEAKFERSRFSSPRATPASSEEPSKEKTSRETSETPKISRTGRVAKE